MPFQSKFQGLVNKIASTTFHLSQQSSNTSACWLAQRPINEKTCSNLTIKTEKQSVKFVQGHTSTKLDLLSLLSIWEDSLTYLVSSLLTLKFH